MPFPKFRLPFQSPTAPLNAVRLADTPLLVPRPRVNVEAQYAPVPQLEVPPYVTDGRMISVRNGIMVDTPAVTAVAPRAELPPSDYKSALAAQLRKMR